MIKIDPETRRMLKAIPEQRWRNHRLLEHGRSLYVRPLNSRAREFVEVLRELSQQPTGGVFHIDGFYMEFSRRGIAPYGLSYTLYEECLSKNRPGWE